MERSKVSDVPHSITPYDQAANKKRSFGRKAMSGIFNAVKHILKGIGAVLDEMISE